MVRLRTHSLLVLRRLQRRDVGIRFLHPRHRVVVQRCHRDSRDGLSDYQCGDIVEWGDGGVISRAVSRAGEGRVGILGELRYGITADGRNGKERVMGADECVSGHYIESDTGDVLVCNSDREWG